MKNLKKILVIVLLFITCPVVEAQTIDHFYSKASSDITFNDDASASVALAGRSIDMSGNIDGIAAVAGDRVVLSGTSEYAFVAGNNIELEGTVTKDAFIAGNLITSKNDAKFSRDVIIFGKDVELSGTFDRDVTVMADKVTIKGANIAGNVKLQSEKVVIESGTITKELSYPKDAVTNISDSAVIGSIVKTEPISNDKENVFMSTLSSKIWSFACYALVFAFICLLLPKTLSKINDKYEKVEFGEVVEVITKGLVLFILVPVISVFLMITGIGLPLSLIALALYIIAIYLSTVFTAYLLGYKIWQKVFNKDMNMLLIGLIGLFVLFILNLIPGIRYFVSIITVLVGLGLIWNNIKGSR